jgi:hypothetical protein
MALLMKSTTILSWKGALLGETPSKALSATRDSFKPALFTSDVAGWINCRGRKSRTLVFSLQPPSNEFGANSKSPLKWTKDNHLATINPPCSSPAM